MKPMNFITVIMVLMSMMLSPGCSPQKTRTKKFTKLENKIIRLDPAINALIGENEKLEMLSEGYEWAEGPVWVKQKYGNPGYLLFSDIPRNSIYKWSEQEGTSLFIKPSGYHGNSPSQEPGSNGLAIDSNGKLILCEHGNRRVSRLKSLADPNGPRDIIVQSYKAALLNSPNDLAFSRKGNIYFTDPPYGLKGRMEDPSKEIPFQGVYRVTPTGQLTLLTDKMSRPNGIAFSPDYSKLYVANSDPKNPIIMVYKVKSDGLLDQGQVFFDASIQLKKFGKGLPDGLKVDQHGNLFATGPGGVLVISPEGKHLGTITTGQATANCAFGDDGKTLYITADMLLLRIRLKVKGAHF